MPFPYWRPQREREKQPEVSHCGPQITLTRDPVNPVDCHTASYYLRKKRPWVVIWFCPLLFRQGKAPAQSHIRASQGFHLCLLMAPACFPWPKGQQRCESLQRLFFLPLTLPLRVTYCFPLDNNFTAIHTP